ncbi:MAG: LacI family DNA-binding transcriptional regulator [Armatimonadota bacterium]
METKPRKASMAAIARHCGVSKMTVSRALNNDPKVSESTRTLVFRAAEMLGFLPSSCSVARGNCATGHYWILLQKDFSSDAYFSEVVINAQRTLFDQGYGCSLGIIENEYSDFIRLISIMRSSNSNGVIVVGDLPLNYVDTLLTGFLNVVFVDYPGDPDISRPYQAVCTDQEHGARLALRHLLKLGRRRILLICGQKGHYFSNDLLRAYREELIQNEIEIDPSRILYADHHVTGGYEAAKQALADGVKFDSVLSNDEMACGAINALKEHGLSIPEDVSVVGFDGLPLGQVVTPPLTTVVIDRARMAKLAVERLLATTDASVDTSERICLLPKLLIRQSCGGDPEVSR